MYKVVCFDFDDVIIDGNISDVLGGDFRGKLEKLRMLTRFILKRKDPDRLSDIVVQGARLARGMEESKVREMAGKLELSKGCEECLKELKKDGRKLTIVSVNDERLIKHVLKKNQVLNMFEEIHAGEFVVEDGKATGEVKGTVFEEGKGKVIKEIMDEHELEKDEVACVGDGLSDVPMFKESGFAIVFNPKRYIMRQLSIDQELKAKNGTGDLAVVRGDIDLIPDVIRKRD